jgi:hypothetical protein
VLIHPVFFLQWLAGHHCRRRANLKNYCKRRRCVGGSTLRSSQGGQRHHIQGRPPRGCEWRRPQQPSGQRQELLLLGEKASRRAAGPEGSSKADPQKVVSSCPFPVPWSCSIIRTWALHAFSPGAAGFPRVLSLLAGFLLVWPPIVELPRCSWCLP